MGQKQESMKNPNTQLEKSILLNDSILVEFVDGKEETKSGIILPDSHQLRAKVHKVGPGLYTQNGEQLPMQIEEGDAVLLQGKKDNYSDVKLDGNTYYMATERKVELVLGRET